MIKRLIDVIVAFSLLLLLMPALGLIALLVLVFLGQPVLFYQLRPGLHGKPFSMVKFRTMLDTYGHGDTPLPDAARLTPFGDFLRRFSLDELPELWNVLNGDMSLVGPRPLLMEYLPLYSSEQARRHNAKPGITGWAQINGRNAIDWNRKFQLDVWYVENQSFWLDVTILMLTIKKVICSDDITGEGQATVEYFKGNKDD